MMTAVAAIWYYRRVITANAGNLILGGILPGFGAAFMAFVIIYSLVTKQLTTTNLVFGFGLAAVGLVLSFIVAYTRHPAFYRDPRRSYGDKIDEELASDSVSETHGPGSA